MIKIIPSVLTILAVLAITPAPNPPIVCFEPTHFQRVVDDISTEKNPFMCPKGK